MGVIVEKGDTSQIGRRAKDIDRYVGARVRERRMMSGITQHELAEMIDVTYQQMNKYETGTNIPSIYPIFRRHTAPLWA